MILAVGTDLVPVDRLARSLERSPSLLTRLFSSRELALLGFDAERQLPGQLTSTRAASLAARFAAKEAVLKALGTLEAEVSDKSERVPHVQHTQQVHHAQHWRYTEIEVLSRPGTPPRLQLSGEMTAYAAQLVEANVEAIVEAAEGVESIGHFDAPAGERPRSEMPPETGDLTELDRAWAVREAGSSASGMSWHLSLAHDGGMALAFVILELSD